METLLREGADPNNRDANGYNCLFWAMRRQRREIPALLVAYGAKNAAGETENVEAYENELAEYEFARQEYERLQGSESAVEGGSNDEKSLV